ncbi:MAG: hypothetical protein INH41_04940 [Myxococcaceae bacterium]|jgi:hypothetical protein|nr:hypothetical protein [Myxococcaceae bacterium]MCA3011729.1 hypothetical protein [Myxococcaceae bacterium]
MASTAEDRTCGACGATLSAKDLDRALGVGTCHACGAVMALGDEAPARAPKAKAPRPSNAVIDERHGRLQVSWPMVPRAVGTAAALLAVACAAGLVLTLALPSLHARSPAFIGLVATFAAVAWVALTLALNDTIFRAEDDRLVITYGPLPRPGTTVPRAEVAQLYVEQTNPERFAVMAQLRDGGRVLLVDGLAHRDEALWLEQAVESRWNIVDRPVDAANEVWR